MDTTSTKGARPNLGYDGGDQTLPTAPRKTDMTKEK